MNDSFYHIKGFMLVDGAIDCRFDMIVPSFNEVIEFFRCVSLHEEYDVIKVYPEVLKEV